MLMRLWYRLRRASHRSTDTEQPAVGEVVPVNPLLDQMGDDPDIALRRRWKEDCRSYRLRLQVFLQGEVLKKEKFDHFLSILLKTERS